MHIKTIFTEEKSAFASDIRVWLLDRGFNVESYDESAGQTEMIDGVVLFHENHNFDKHITELRDRFDALQVAMHKIDISGTINVALSHLNLFFERTQCKHVLFLGSNNLNNHPKMELFKEKWAI